MDSDSEWRERGVEFKLVDEAMIPSVIELLDESFFPDEPLFRCLIYAFAILIIGITLNVLRSLGMTLANTGWLKDMYIKALKDGSSVVAVDKEGKLMGVRVGNVTRLYHHSSINIFRVTRRSRSDADDTLRRLFCCDSSNYALSHLPHLPHLHPLPHLHHLP